MKKLIIIGLILFLGGCNSIEGEMVVVGVRVHVPEPHCYRVEIDAWPFNIFIYTNDVCHVGDLLGPPRRGK